ncbi:CARDB domain-containing protein [Litoreibacter arenae]|uniref:CARDB domain-containing protein n=1 Tax=Litoreibacter arenae DSM 19593 TaxID=1123360 RepID=S9RRA3_9RHOB|nr:CARDB domain-containing protein [Litoreibacter arenae]EPX76504.1 hypothetical protein thalar_03678 [Litoreibacter arenae DSM 19593]
MVQIRFDGNVYEITDSSDIAVFEARLDGRAVDDAATLAALYAHGRALQFVKFWDDRIDLGNNIDASRNLVNSLIELYAVDAATDFVTQATGSIIGFYATGGTIGSAGISSAIGAGLSQAASSAGRDLLEISADFIPLLAGHAALDAVQRQHHLNAARAEDIVADYNLGRIIDAEDIAETANAFVNHHSALVSVGSYFAADELLGGNWLTDSADFIANLAKGAFGPAVNFVEDGGAKVGELFMGIVGSKKYLDNVQLGGELVAMGLEVADIVGLLLDGTLEGYNELQSNSISQSNDYFASNKTLPPPVPTDQVDHEYVTSSSDSPDINDARIFIDDAFFSEGATGSQAFQVSLSEALPHDVTLEYSVYDISGAGQAKAGTDFIERLNQTLVIRAGRTEAIIPVSIIDDDTTELPLERINLAIYNPVGATLPNGAWNDVFTGYILDDEYLQQRVTNQTVNDYIVNGSGGGGTSPPPNTSGGANLAAIDFTSSLRSASFGEDLEIDFTVRNIGDAESEIARVQVILARDSWDFENGTVLEDYNVSSMDPGDQTRYRKTVELPTSGRGDYNIGIRVLPALGENQPSGDDTDHVPLTIGAGLSGAPDLRAYGSDIRDSILQVGETVSYQYRIVAGSDGSPAYSHQLYLSADEHLSQDDLLVFSGSDDGLGYHGNNYVTAQFTLPSLPRDGGAYFIAVADSGDDVVEGDETNNVRSSQFSLTSNGPDTNALTNLTASGLYLSDSVITVGGDRFRYEARVAITSVDDPVPTLDRYAAFQGGAYTASLILSEDRVFDPEDIVINTTLKSGANIVDETGVLMDFPSYVPTGSYFLAHAVDLLDEILEDNENDNFSEWQRIDVVNVNPQVVHSVDDIVFVVPGETVSVDVVENDTNTIGEELALWYLGYERAGSSTYDGLDLGGGIRLNYLGNNLVEIDATNAPSGYSTEFKVPYTATSSQTSQKGFATLELHVGERRFSPSFGETGTITLNHTASTVTLQNTYDNPVVIAFIATENGTQPVNVRVTDIGGDQLSLQLQEPNYLDGSHVNETVNYLVVEAGTWVLPDGTLLEAGTLTTNQLSSQGFEDVAFDAEFDTTPVLLSQVQTDNGGDFVTPRQTGTNADGFQITMQEEDALNSGGHVTETVGWVAIEPGSGSSGGLDWIAGHATGISDANATVSLAGSFAGGANVIASLASFSGGDSAWVRGNGSTTNDFDISVEEEASLNAETGHVAEAVDYFVFNGTAAISAYDYDFFV